MNSSSDCGEVLNKNGEFEKLDYDLKIKHRKFSCFSVWLLMNQKTNKVGLLHLSKKYPTVFGLEDFTSIGFTLIDQQDFLSFEIYKSPAMKSMFNTLTIENGCVLL